MRITQSPPSPPQLRQMDWGDNALTAPTTPRNTTFPVDKSKVPPEVLKAAQGMETMFLNYMMKVMRDTVPSSDMDLESPATKIYRAELDQKYAEKAAHAGGIGLADQIVAYMESQRYTIPSRTGGHGVPQSDPTDKKVRLTGGTHEGQLITE